MILKYYNNHEALGILESTLLRSFVRASNLKHWLVDPSAPLAIKEAKTIFDEFYNPSARGTFTVLSDGTGENSN